MEKTIIIIMGAAVQRDGQPSNAMIRRVQSALGLRGKFENLIFMPTGGVGSLKPRSEALAMQELLINAGVKKKEIIAESESKDTLQSMLNCSRIIKGFDHKNTVIICSDLYHIFRCRWLLYLLGISTIYQPMLSGRSANGLLHWAYYHLREFFATPFDTFLIIILKIMRKI